MTFISKHDPFTFNNGSYALRIEGNSNWQTEDIDGVTYQTFTTQLDGEMEAKFGYVQN